MCPACWINASLLFVLGSGALTIIQHPITITIGVILTAAGIYYIYRGLKKNKGKGGLQKNFTTTFLVISSFLFGYLTAAFQTHDYFKDKSGLSQSIEECESCQLDLMDIGK